MTPSERQFWSRIQRRAATLSPDLQRAILSAFQRIRDSMTEAEIVRALALGGADRLFEDVLTQAVLDVAFQPVRDQIRTGVGSAFRYTAKTIPAPPAQTVTFAFDVLNPRIVDAIRSLETKVITSLDTAVRETVRAVIERGLVAGTAPKVMAQELRQLIGLGPSQLQQVENYRDSLSGLNGRKETDYTLRDKRFATGKERSPEQIDRMVEAYSKRRIQQNAETTARTAALDAQKLGQKLSWDDAVRTGTVDGARLRKRWATVLDGRERPEHHEMNGAEAPWDGAYVNGDRYAGEGDPWNCRCLDIYFVA